MRPFRYLDWFFQDARLAWRSLRLRPGFAAVVLVTLALGVGANTAIFSLVKAVLLNPLPYGQPSRLVVISETAPVAPDAPNADYATAVALRRSSRSFEHVSAFRDGPGVLMEN